MRTILATAVPVILLLASACTNTSTEAEITAEESTTTTIVTTTTTFAATTTTTEEPNPCGDAIDEMETFTASLMDGIDNGAERDMDGMTAMTSKVVGECPGDLLAAATSSLVLIYRAEEISTERSESAASFAGDLVETVCGLDVTFSDEARSACEAHQAENVPTSDRVREAFVQVWDTSLRSSMLEGLQLSTDIKSVDVLDFDATSDTIYIDVTSTWASLDNQVDGGWSITRALAVLWEADSVMGSFENWSPNLTLVNSGTRYECSADFMLRLADVRASKADWLAECS